MTSVSSSTYSGALSELMDATNALEKLANIHHLFCCEIATPATFDEISRAAFPARASRMFIASSICDHG